MDDDDDDDDDDDYSYYDDDDDHNNVERHDKTITVTWAQATAVTILAPFLAMPLASESLPIMKPVWCGVVWLGVVWCDVVSRDVT